MVSTNQSVEMRECLGSNGEYESDYGKVVITNQSVEMRECLSRKENRGSGEAKAQVCCCRFTWAFAL